MTIPTRTPVIRYLLAQAALLRRPGTPRAAAKRLDEHAAALELLAEHVRRLPEDDERLLLLGTLAVRDDEFVPGPVAEHALTQFTGASVEEREVFLTQVSHIALDDALVRAREYGFLPPRPV